MTLFSLKYLIQLWAQFSSNFSFSTLQCDFILLLFLGSIASKMSALSKHWKNASLDSQHNFLCERVLGGCDSFLPPSNENKPIAILLLFLSVYSCIYVPAQRYNSTRLCMYVCMYVCRRIFSPILQSSTYHRSTVSHVRLFCSAQLQSSIALSSARASPVLLDLLRCRYIPSRNGQGPDNTIGHLHHNAQGQKFIHDNNTN
ncbi:YMR244C-A-like protein [Saccharomyces cerevisiae FostersO]|nr:YMR244C-A-like protein [Saccharomyces cerevisiae FostersO]